MYATVFVASMLFPALSTIFKEQIFTKAKETLRGKQLDIFVVSLTCQLQHVCGSKAWEQRPVSCQAAAQTNPSEFLPGLEAL